MDPNPPTPPTGVPVSEYVLHRNGNGTTTLKVAFSVLAGAFVGLVVALFTALQNKGVTHDEMHAYVKEYSPYILDKQSLSEHNAQQDEKIGQVKGVQERVLERLSKLEYGQQLQDTQAAELKEKIKLVSDYMEAERDGKPKR